MTVNTPTTAETTATTPPIDGRGVDRRAGEEAGLEHPACSSWCMAGQPASTRRDRRRGPPLGRGRRARRRPGRGRARAARRRAAVQPAEHLGRGRPRGGAAGGPPGGQVDDAVHHRQQRVHLVGGQQHGDLLLAGDAGEQADDLLAAAEVEVGQRLVQQQQPGAADQGVRDQHPLLLAAGQSSRPGHRRSGSASTACSISATASRRARERSGIPNRCPSIPSATRSRARIGMSGSSRTFCGT